jgi:hypothetical protein
MRDPVGALALLVIVLICLVLASAGVSTPIAGPMPPPRSIVPHYTDPQYPTFGVDPDVLRNVDRRR